MADIDIGKAPPLYAVLPFYGTGALSFLVLSVLLLFSAGDWQGHYFSPHLLALTHMEALGWGSMVIFGSAYQILPVICETDLFSSRLALYSYGCLLAGVAMLVTSFWWFRAGGIMITGGFLIVTAATLYSINVYYTVGTCKRYSIQKLFIFSSAAWLLLTTLAGLLLAANLSTPFITTNHLDLLKLHAHAGIAGWFLQLITGVSTKLVPMFLLGKSSKTRLLYLSFTLQNAGLLGFILDSLLAGPSGRFLFYEILIVTGIAAWLIWLYDCFKNRARKAIDWPMKHVALSILCLLAAILFPPILYYAGHSPWSLVYGLFLFQGWITFLILGMTFKTLPFIVWNQRYKNLNQRDKNGNGKAKIPMPKHLYHEKWLPYQLVIHSISLLLLLTGIIIKSSLLIRLAVFTGLAAALLYTSNVAAVLFHKTTPK
ncbi:MAG: hypothetical protein JST68_02965 [Bacteroidetes bacterium]|nr:hypothetical protein [Bacteroidota bacterium]